MAGDQRRLAVARGKPVAGVTKAERAIEETVVSRQVTVFSFGEELPNGVHPGVFCSLMEVLREFLIRGTNTTPLPLFFVSVDSRRVRERGPVSVDSKGGLSGFRMNRSEEFCKC